MLDLFGTTSPPGFASAEMVVTPAEEAAMIARIDESNLSSLKFQQWTGKRLTRSFGWSYDFETGRFAPADPIPSWLKPLRDRASHFAGIDPADLVQALLIRYDPGDGIGWHKDRPVSEHVIGISLREPATMRFRGRVGPKFERASRLLMPRSIYHLRDEVRRNWEHSIVPMEKTRWSITFRSLSGMGGATAS